MGITGKINHIRWQKNAKVSIFSHVAAYGYH